MNKKTILLLVLATMSCSNAFGMKIRRSTTTEDKHQEILEAAQERRMQMFKQRTQKLEYTQKRRMPILREEFQTAETKSLQKSLKPRRDARQYTVDQKIKKICCLRELLTFMSTLLFEKQEVEQNEYIEI